MQRYSLDRAVTTIIAATAIATSDTQQESEGQAAAADRLLLTKTDLVSPDRVEALATRLRTINAAVPITPMLNGEVDPTPCSVRAFHAPTL
ncbi:GTP-binding protein [Sphingomonas mucosissima]|uniref:Putative GTP-binding protein YjiA n=1 Tax=Sphingomonas mucosissima TaxID=370959 RepID=A0A245ZDC2_9SPHN|nr:GTP-binding protein [Sphingomonas mucosissima]OWK27705.1 putative GTP-binding protein YjiA [Sphingomonas mucosissima]